MTITFYCDSCGKKLKADDAFAGRDVACTGCGAPQLVPEPLEAGQEQARFRGSFDLPDADVEVDSNETDPKVTFKRKTDLDDGLDMTPMVDMTFLLLIFFMVTCAFALQKSLKVPTPELPEEGTEAAPDTNPEEEADSVIVRIDSDSRVWLEDVECASSHELYNQLLKAQNPAGSTGMGLTKLRVQISEEAKSERLVMALDMGAQAKFVEAKVETLEDE